MNFLSLLLIPRWAIFGAMAAALLGLYGWHVHEVRSARADGRAEVQAKWDADIAKRNALAETAAETRRVKEATHAAELAKERTQRAADLAVAHAAAAAARSQLQRLRATIGDITARPVQPGANPATRADPDAVTASIGDVLSECAGEAVELGEQAEDLAVRLRGLQAWARSAVRVCGPPIDPEIPEDGQQR